MRLIKNVYFVILLFLVLASACFLAVSFMPKAGGVVVLFVDNSSKCNIEPGNTISSAAGAPINDIDGFKGIESTVKQGEYIQLIVNGVPGGCVAYRDGSIGLVVTNPKGKGILFAKELSGSTTIQIRFFDNLSDSKELIGKRIAHLGLPETYTQIVGDELRITTLYPEKIGLLITKGDFVTRIGQIIDLTDDLGELKIGGETYTVEALNDSIKLGNASHAIGEEFNLNGFDIIIKNVTNTSVVLETLFFTNGDVEKVLYAYSMVSYAQGAGGYEYTVPLEITQTASARFQNITKGMKTTFVGTTPVLSGYLIYYMDGKALNNLNIPYELVGQELRTISVMGIKKNQADAIAQKQTIETVLISGELPDYEILGIEFESGGLSGALWPLVAGIFALSIVGAAVFSRKTIASCILLIISNILLVFGLAAASQMLFGYGWVIDLPTIAGLYLIAISSFQFLTNKHVKTYEIAMLIASFVLLFTPLKGFGVCMILNVVLMKAVLRPFYKTVSKAF